MLKSLFLSALAVAALALQTRDTEERAALPLVPRSDMIATARRLQEHGWTCRAENTKAACVTGYESDFKAGQQVKGIAYDWGGFDPPEEFNRKLAGNQAAGSHSRHGVTACTAGIDCSGFVSRCWGQRTKFGTATLEQIAVRPRYNWFRDLRPGDVMNKLGSHVVLFAGYEQDGRPIVYEASGSKGRVILNTLDWSALKGYFPLQYKGVRED